MDDANNTADSQPGFNLANEPQRRTRGHVKRTATSVDMNTFKSLRRNLRLTQQEVANMLGIHRTYLVLIEKGKKIPSLRLERAILEFIEKAERQEVNPRTWVNPGQRPNVYAASGSQGRRVPVVSWAAAGQAKAYEDLSNQIDELVETDCRDQNCFAIIIEGDSMEDRFFAGDRVVFAPNLEPRNGDAVVAKLKDGRVYFKWFARTGPEGSKVRLTSQNPNYSPMEFDHGDLEFVYPAWEIKRRLRR